MTFEALAVRPLPQKLLKILVKELNRLEVPNRLLVFVWGKYRGMTADFSLK